MTLQLSLEFLIKVGVFKVLLRSRHKQFKHTRTLKQFVIIKSQWGIRKAAIASRTTEIFTFYKVVFLTNIDAAWMVCTGILTGTEYNVFLSF